MSRANGKTQAKGIPESPKGSPLAYTPDPEEQLRRGLRILARMIVRAHLRCEAPAEAASAPPDPPSERTTGT